MPLLHWFDNSWHTYDSQIMYATNTKHAKLNALDDMAIVLETGSCKPLVTKLASVLHTLL